MSRRYKQAVTFLTLCVAWVIHGVSWLMPRKRDLWIFIGWHEGPTGGIFADNAKYLFLHTAQTRSRVQSIWLARDNEICERLRSRGYRAEHCHSLQGAWLSLRAGVTVTDGNLPTANWRFSGGSYLVQLWHGKGPKKVNQSASSFSKNSRFMVPGQYVRFHQYIAYSDYAAYLIAKSFAVPKEMVSVTGLPKYDVLRRTIPDEGIDVDKELEAFLEERDSQTVRYILYAPTFRADGSNPAEKLDLGAIDEFCEQNGFKWCGLLHPKFARKRNTCYSAQYSHIRFFDPGYDVYPLLKHFSLLVTDYSSLAVDFMFMSKPVVYYVYDLLQYREQVGLYEKFWSQLQGERVSSFTELGEVILQQINRHPNYVNNTHFFKYLDGNSCKRVGELIAMSVNKV